MTMQTNTTNEMCNTRDARKNYMGVSRLHDDIDRMFANFMNPLAAFAEMSLFRRTAGQTGLMPSMDVSSDEKQYTVKAELPGVAPEDVKLQVQDGVLTICGVKKEEKSDARQHLHECSYGEFTRSVALPDDADTDAITAKAANGVLCVNIPRKAPAKDSVKKITVQAA